VDTGSRRSESGVPAAELGASVIGPSPLSPDRRLRLGPGGDDSTPVPPRAGPSRPGSVY